MIFEASALLQLLGSTLRISTPLVYAALGGLLSERSGVINIALEGMMLVGAFTAATVAYFTHSPEWGAVSAGVAGGAFAAVYAFFVIQWKANQIVAGMALNMLALGITPFFSKVLFQSAGSTPSLQLHERFHSAPIWGTGFFLVFLIYWIQKTPSGLWVRFAGEHPKALESAGIRVNRVRWACVIGSGVLAGLGGASLSIFLSSSFSRNMTAGRGFMALAAMIFGKWMPLPTLIACLLFGFTEALQIRLQGVILWGTEPVPVQFVQILPYLVTILILAGFVGKSRAPKALGQSYESG